MENKIIRKILIKCYENKTDAEQKVILQYFLECSAVIDVFSEIVKIMEKIKIKEQEKGD